MLVDAGQVIRPISPLIYGAAGDDPTLLREIGARVHRWGGNANSRYNWELGNAWNASRDWEFRNGNYGNASAADRQPSGVADRFVATNKSFGAETLISIPALGWVARDDNTNTHSTGVPPTGGAPLPDNKVGAIRDYDPSANRAATSVRSSARKGAPFADPPDLGDDHVYQDEWVAHLVKRFGTAAAGGVRFYAIDNEPDLWGETHTDVHPVRPGYDDVLATFLEYAGAIKDVDPTARVLGPALSGWTALLYSALDRGSDNFREHADRKAHGDTPFLPWWLDQVRQHDAQAGRRTLDVLDVHYYPQAAGVYSAASDPGTSALRLRSTRALWDADYRDESWIGEPVRLIPRLREWIDRYYPGTQLAIGEWNWGGETSISGALAVADVLGIFGREGVDIATYWTAPPRGSPAAAAFKLYASLDGNGGGFGDQALRVTADAPVDDLSAYASRDSTRGGLVLVVMNKRADRALSLNVRLAGLAVNGPARVYRLGQDDPASIRDLGEANLAGGALPIDLPALSIAAIRIAAV